MQISKPFSIVMIFIATVAITFFFVVPKYEETLSLRNTLGEKQAEYEGKSEYYAKIEQLTKAIESKEAAFNKINSALPDELYLSSLVYFIQKKASDAGLATKLIVFAKVPAKTDDKKPRAVSFTVNLSGNYQGLKTFLDSLDKSSRLLEVQSISFNSLQTSQSLSQLANPNQIYTFNLQLETRSY